MYASSFFLGESLFPPLPNTREPCKMSGPNPYVIIHVVVLFEFENDCMSVNGLTVIDVMKQSVVQETLSLLDTVL